LGKFEDWYLKKVKKKALSICGNTRYNVPNMPCFGQGGLTSSGLEWETWKVTKPGKAPKGIEKYRMLKAGILESGASPAHYYVIYRKDDGKWYHYDHAGLNPRPKLSGIAHHKVIWGIKGSAGSRHKYPVWYVSGIK